MSTAALAVKSDVTALEIHPVAGRIGAEIRGIKLSGELDASTVEAIQQALLTHKVIFSATRLTSTTKARKPSHSCWASRLRTRRCLYVTAPTT